MLANLRNRLARSPAPPVTPEEARAAVAENLSAHFDALADTRALWAEGELDKELHAHHEMAGAAWYAIAKAKRGEDHLFYAEDGRLALVHLTFSGHRETDPERPLAAVMEDLPSGLRRLRGVLP